jgi:hypothetical protein
MRRSNRFLLLAMVALAGSSAANAQTSMRYQFKEKDRLFYLIEQKTKSTMNLMGAEIVSNLGATTSMYWEVVKVDGQGNAQVRIKVTHSKMSLDSLVGMVEVDSKDKNAPNDPAGRILGQVNKAVGAMEITATMLPTGEMKDVKVSEATIKAFKAVPSADQLGDLTHPDNFKDMLSSLVFPAQTITRGKSWTHRTVSQGPEGKISSEHIFTLEATVDQDGMKLDKIALKPSFKVEPDPNAKVKVKSITATGHVLFDNKAGRVFESVVTQTKQGKIDVMGITLDSTSEQTTTIRLKKQTDTAKEFESVKIDETEYVEKTVATEPLETIAGVSRSFTVARSYEPAITLTGSATVPDDLKAKVEAALGVTIGKKTAIKESITLDGKAITSINVQWVERYRRGTATASDGSTVAFLVRVGMRIKLEKAK